MDSTWVEMTWIVNRQKINNYKQIIIKSYRDIKGASEIDTFLHENC